jgi:superfamily II DNA/RNA helicase
MNCPECRKAIKPEKMVSIVNEIKEPAIVEQQIYSKTDTLLNIIKANPNGKYLVFSKYDSGFVNLSDTLSNHNITSSELKGNTPHMMKVLEKFKDGRINVILLNTHFAGSGIDISYATDVIIYHAMGLAKFQAVGRAQRVGRTDTLNVHYLCYEHEMTDPSNT